MVEKYHVHTLNASKADGFAGRNATTLQLDSFLTIARLNHQQLASQAVPCHEWKWILGDLFDPWLWPCTNMAPSAYEPSIPFLYPFSKGTVCWPVPRSNRWPLDFCHCNAVLVLLGRSRFLLSYMFIGLQYQVIFSIFKSWELRVTSHVIGHVLHSYELRVTNLRVIVALRLAGWGRMLWQTDQAHPSATAS